MAVFSAGWFALRRPGATAGDERPTGPAIGVLAINVPQPANGTYFLADELRRHFPELMADFDRLQAFIPLDRDGLPDYQALAARAPAELARLASQISQVGRAQFRALVQFRMQHFTALERAFGAMEVAQKLLAALDAAEATT
jgi:hypothetical protein